MKAEENQRVSVAFQPIINNNNNKKCIQLYLFGWEKKSDNNK